VSPGPWGVLFLTHGLGQRVLLRVPMSISLPMMGSRRASNSGSLPGQGLRENSAAGSGRLLWRGCLCRQRYPVYWSCGSAGYRESRLEGGMLKIHGAQGRGPVQEHCSGNSEVSKLMVQAALKPLFHETGASKPLVVCIGQCPWWWREGSFGPAVPAVYEVIAWK